MIGLPTNQSIQEGPPRMQRTTAITETQLTELTELVRPFASAPPTRGRPIRLTLREQVRLTVTYLRTNNTQQFLAEIFGVSQATASRVIGRLTAVLGWLLQRYVPD